MDRIDTVNKLKSWLDSIHEAAGTHPSIVLAGESASFPLSSPPALPYHFNLMGFLGNKADMLPDQGVDAPTFIAADCFAVGPYSSHISSTFFLKVV